VFRLEVRLTAGPDAGARRASGDSRFHRQRRRLVFQPYDEEDADWRQGNMTRAKSIPVVAIRYDPAWDHMRHKRE
jgi:hypothetical protein